MAAEVPPVHLVLGEPAVGRYLDQHGVLAYVPIDAVLVRSIDPETGQPCVMFSALLPDGQRVISKIALHVLQRALEWTR